MAGPSANQTGLSIHGATPDVVMPNAWNFKLTPNAGVAPVAAAPTPLTLQTSNNDYGFGQNIRQWGRGETLESLKITSAALVQAQCSVTLRIYDLTTWVPTTNFSFLQETPQPTQAPTTVAPTVTPYRPNSDPDDGRRARGRENDERRRERKRQGRREMRRERRRVTRERPIHHLFLREMSLSFCPNCSFSMATVRQCILGEEI